jgi:hypothetical protein
MSTIREQLVAAQVTALNTGRPSGVPEFKRSPFLQIDLSDAAPISAEVYAVDDTEDAVGNMNDSPLQDHDLITFIELRAIGPADAIPEVVLDPTAAWVVKALNGNKFNGLSRYTRVVRTQLGRQSDVERPTVKMLVAVLTKFQTRAKDAEQKA